MKRVIEVFNKVATALKQFTNTEKFKHSFFARAQGINADFNGENIWTNNITLLH